MGFGDSAVVVHSDEAPAIESYVSSTARTNITYRASHTVHRTHTYICIMHFVKWPRNLLAHHRRYPCQFRCFQSITTHTTFSFSFSHSVWHGPARVSVLALILHIVLKSIVALLCLASHRRSLILLFNRNREKTNGSVLMCCVRGEWTGGLCLNFIRIVKMHHENEAIKLVKLELPPPPLSSTQATDYGVPNELNFRRIVVCGGGGGIGSDNDFECE